MNIEEAIARQKEPLRSQLQELFRHFPRDNDVILRTVREGVPIMEEGELSVTVFLMLEGSVTTFWSQPGHSQYLASHEQPLTFLGDLAALAGFEKHTASVRTVTRCRFLTMHRDVFMYWMYRDVDTYRMLTRNNLRMLSAQARESRSAVMRSSEARILEYLSWHYEMGRTVNTQAVLIRKTREEIAEDIGGISLRTLNRYLAEMADRGWINMVKGKIQVTQKQNRKIVEIVETIKNK